MLLGKLLLKLFPNVSAVEMDAFIVSPFFQVMIHGKKGTTVGAVCFLMEDLVEEQPEPVPSQALRPEPVVGSVRVRYNHYNQEFRLLDNALQWADVDEAYCISYVFEGAFRPRIVDAAGASFQRDAAGAFAPLQDGGAYTLAIDEDEAAEAAATAANPRRAAGVVAAEPVPGVNSASARLTAELKTLSVEELAGQSDRYRELKEARDLEDVLFSG